MDDAQALLTHAEEHLDARALEDALVAFDAAERAGAEADRCAAGRWMAWMLRGDFSLAWSESDAIRARRAADPHRFWNGEDIDGKRVIVRCLHGLGDAVQCLRYVPALRRRAAHLIVEVPPALLQLAPYFDGMSEVITWGEQAPLQPPAWDVQVEVTELPYLFRTELRDLPLAANYIHLPKQLQSQSADAFGTSRRPRIGVVWSSGEWNVSRSIPFHHLTKLLHHSECEFWNSQGGPARNEWTQLNPSAHLHDAPEFCDAGVLPLAAFISHLDLVITVDTLAAHLAGALGIPAWVMLQHSADWRWMVHREDSPWYPSLRLFRQEQQGDWRGVIEQVEEALSAQATDTRPREAVA